MNPRPLVGALALAGLLGAGGCVANDVSLAIGNFLPADGAAGMAGMCLHDAASVVSLNGGTYDVVLGRLYQRGYEAAFVVRNNLGTVSGADVETNAYYVQSYNVQLEVLGPAQPFLPSITDREFKSETATTRVAPGELIAGSATVIKPKKLDDLADIDFSNDPVQPEIIARIAPVATRAEEQQIGATAAYPIHICRGCLIESNPKTPYCSGYAKGSSLKLGNACNPAADDVIGCCLLGDATSPGRLVCGAEANLAIPQ